VERRKTKGTYSGMKNTPMDAVTANPYCAQKTARYAHRFVYTPVVFTISATVNGPRVYARAVKQVIPLRASGAIYMHKLAPFNLLKRTPA
jgi:hypothetical protein